MPCNRYAEVGEGLVRLLYEASKVFLFFESLCACAPLLSGWPPLVPVPWTRGRSSEMYKETEGKRRVQKK